MRARTKSVLNKLASLLGWGFVHGWSVRIHSYLAARYDDHPGFQGWLWRLIHVREWQKSTATRSVIWVLGTLIIYKLVERLGYGWEVNTGVSLTLDYLVYLVHKLWVFRDRKIALPTSSGRSILVWAVFFPVNIGLAWLVYSRTHIGTLPARSLLGCYGVAMNPVMFKIRDSMVFNQVTLRKLALGGWQVFRRFAMA